MRRNVGLLFSLLLKLVGTSIDLGSDTFRPSSCCLEAESLSRGSSPILPKVGEGWKPVALSGADNGGSSVRCSSFSSLLSSETSVAPGLFSLQLLPLPTDGASILLLDPLDNLMISIKRRNQVSRAQ